MRTLDAEQLRAVETHDGTVQIIAPAGSGKTTVLIERVRELLRRGVPADRILGVPGSTVGEVADPPPEARRRPGISPPSK